MWASSDDPTDRRASATGPHDVLAARRVWPLHDTRGSREIEARMLKRWADGALMAWAGRRVAHWVLALAPHARHVWVAAGPGGNGGDGLHAAAHLARLGRRVDITLHPGVTPHTEAALHQALASGCRLIETPNTTPADLVIDALLGLGANRPLSQTMQSAVQGMLRHGRPILSIDAPTGLDAETGQALGPIRVQAQATLSLLTLKPGLLMGEGRDAAGRIWLDTLDDSAGEQGINPVAQTTCRPSPVAAPARRLHASHKGRFGDVVVVGGAAGMLGALRLAAHAALAAGAGRVIAVPLDAAAPLWDWGRPECMWMRPQDRLNPYRLDEATVVCGCGGGAPVAELLPALLERADRVVLDADALNAAAQMAPVAAAVRARAERGRATVLTPHPLEAARLLKQSVADVQGRRLEAASLLAHQFQATVVLKGSGTVIATPGLLSEVNITGNGALATGGTGDVLAGWLGGCWASSEPLGLRGSGEPSEEAERAHRVARDAAFVHGLAADRHGSQNAFRALDLMESMRQLAT